MKRITSLLLCALLTLQLFSTQVVFAEVNMNFEEDFDGYEPDTVPSSLEINSSGGSVRVKEIPNIESESNRALFIENTSEGMYCSVTKNFDTVKDVTAVIDVAFMQHEVKADGTVIIEATGDLGCFLRIMTSGGDIGCETAGGDYIELVKNYQVNRWYKLTAELDLYSQKADLYADNTLVYNDAAFLKSSGTLKSVTSYTNVSPGYYIDNFRIKTDKVVSGVTIDGANRVSIPSEGSRDYKFSAKATDKNGVTIKGVEFTMEATYPSGVSFTADESGLTLTVTSTAAANSVAEIIASAPGYPEGRKTVTLQSQNLSAMKISGPMRITYSPKHDLQSYQYSAQYMDALGNEIQGLSCTYTLEAGDGLEKVPDEITIDPTSGMLTVSGDIKKYEDKRIAVKATAEGGSVSASYPVALAGIGTYIADEARINTVREYLGNVLAKGTDPFVNTPLIADALVWETGEPFEWRFPTGQKVAMTNLANQGNLMRIMDGFSALYGDTTYSDRVRDIYQYYLDNYIADNGLVHWGGHSAIDLKTGNIIYAANHDYIHEVKNHYPYLEPFFELDPAQMDKTVKSVWISHMKDWQLMIFERHGYYNKDVDFTKWDTMVDRFDDSITGLIPTLYLPFREAANDYLDMAVELFRHNGDETAMTHAMHLWSRYEQAAWPTTGLGGYLPTNANLAPGKYDVPDKWWESEGYVTIYGNVRYGDRYYNQFAKQMVEEGWISADDAPKLCLDPYFLTNTSGTRNDPFLDVEFAKALRESGDTAGYERVMKYISRRLSSYSYYAYDEATNSTRPILADGTDLTGFTFRIRGYAGNAGTRWTELASRSDTFLAYCKTYLETMNAKEMGVTFDGEIDTYLRNMWNLINGCMKGWGIGNFGENYPGDGTVEYNTNCSYSEDNAMLALIYLYEATQIPEFLDAARSMGNRLIEDNYHNGLFGSSSKVNVRLSGADVETPYSLLYLEAVLLGRSDMIPVYKQYQGFFNSDILYDNGRYQWKAQDQYTVYVEKKIDVKVTDIVPENTMYLMKTGERVPMSYTVEPNDADEQEVFWFNSDADVARFDEEEGEIYAISPGRTVLTGVSADANARVRIEIIVEG